MGMIRFKSRATAQAVAFFETSLFNVSALNAVAALTHELRDWLQEPAQHNQPSSARISRFHLFKNGLGS